MKLLKLIGLLSLGRWYFIDCLIAVTKIFSHLLRLIFFLSDLSQIIGVISSIPISVAFSRNHSNLLMFFVGAKAMCK